MRARRLSPSTAPIDRYHLCFALGKALEDRGDILNPGPITLGAMRSNAKRAAIVASHRSEYAKANGDMLPRIFPNRIGWGSKRRDPIFIVGLPRSGSTLIEQILASHWRVEGTHELATYRCRTGLQGRDGSPDAPRYPAALAEMRPEDFYRLGDKYINDTQMYRTGRPFFIDKMPNNFRHIGLIHLMLPNARIIDARREPMACCFTNLKQLFARDRSSPTAWMISPAITAPISN